MNQLDPSPHDASRAEYARRMHRVLAYIDSHLAEPIDLAALADVAHFSRYHFHRVFAAWMGETAGEYLWRRRVEVAAVKLRSQPRLSVLQAALAVGFGLERVYALFMVPARQQKAAIEAHAAGHAGGLDKACNEECGFLLPCPKGCPAKGASAALQILAGPPARLRFAPCTCPFGGATGTMKRA